MGDKGSNTPDIASEDQTVTIENDKEKSERTLSQIAYLYSIKKKRLITDAELQVLCRDWDIAYKACLYFLTYRHFIVYLCEYEIQVSRQWFVEGASLATANDNIVFKRREFNDVETDLSILLYTKKKIAKLSWEVEPPQLPNFP